ncbi:unnamed protein product [Cunninghamella echinulata]
MESSDYSDNEYAPISLAAWGDQQKKTKDNGDDDKDKVADWHSLANPSLKVKSGGIGSGGLHRRGPNYKPVDEEYILQQRLNGNVPKQLKIKALREAEKKVEGGGDKKSYKKSSSSSSSKKNNTTSSSPSSKKFNTSTSSSSSSSSHRFSKPATKSNSNNNSYNNYEHTNPSSISANSPGSTIRRPPYSTNQNNMWSSSTLVETPFWEQNTKSSTTTPTTITTTNTITTSTTATTSLSSSSSASSSSFSSQQQQSLQKFNNKKSTTNAPPGFENSIRSNHMDDQIKRPPGLQSNHYHQQQNGYSINNTRKVSLQNNKNNNNDNGWDNGSWNVGFNNHASSKSTSKWGMEEQQKDHWGNNDNNNNNNNSKNNDSWSQEANEGWGTYNGNNNKSNNNDSWIQGGGWGVSDKINHEQSTCESSLSATHNNNNNNSNNNNQPTRFSNPSKNKYSSTEHSPFPKNYYKKDGTSRPAFIETPSKVALPPISYNPIVVSVHLELENNVKIPVNIHKLDDPVMLARQFGQSQNIDNPKIIQAITKLFTQQKDRAMQRYDK